MANRVFLTGVGISVAVKQSEDGRERLHILLQVPVPASSDVAHVRVIADNPLVINCLRHYRSPRPIYISGTLRSDSDGNIYVCGETVDYARAQQHRTGTPFNPVLKPLPNEKFVGR